MEAGGGDFQHFFGLALAVDVGKIRIVSGVMTPEQFLCVRLHRGQKEVSFIRILSKIIDEFRQGAHADHAYAMYERAFREVAAGNQACMDSSLSGLDHDGQNSLDRPDFPIEPHFARDQHAFCSFFLYISEADQKPDAYGDIDHDAPLGNAGRGQVDGNPAGRQIDSQVSERNADAFAGLSHFAAHKSDHIKSRQSI